MPRSLMRSSFSRRSRSNLLGSHAIPLLLLWLAVGAADSHIINEKLVENVYKNAHANGFSMGAIETPATVGLRNRFYRVLNITVGRAHGDLLTNLVTHQRFTHGAFVGDAAFLRVGF